MEWGGVPQGVGAAWGTLSGATETSTVGGSPKVEGSGGHSWAPHQGPYVSGLEKNEPVGGQPQDTRTCP